MMSLKALNITRDLASTNTLEKWSYNKLDEVKELLEL